jgi:hypothetical protein
MYCPIDGDEFRERVTRCPEHGVDLVEEPPDLEKPISWIARFNDRAAVRLSFVGSPGFSPDRIRSTTWATWFIYIPSCNNHDREGVRQLSVRQFREDRDVAEICDASSSR